MPLRSLIQVYVQDYANTGVFIQRWQCCCVDIDQGRKLPPIEMIKTECDSKNEKVKIFSKELNYYLDILSKFTNWINDKTLEKKEEKIVP